MELSIADLRSLIAGQSSLPDKDYGRAVVILRNGFVFCGKVRRENGLGLLRGVQVRYWAQRSGGLSEFAAKGPHDGDKLDKIDGELEFPWGETNVIGVLPCGNAWNNND